MTKFSSNALAKAAANAKSVAEQAQAMEVVSADFADILDQIKTFDGLGFTPLFNQEEPMKCVQDLQKLTAQCAYRLRAILEVMREKST